MMRDRDRDKEAKNLHSGLSAKIIGRQGQNEPPLWKFQADTLHVTTGPKTDFWCKTRYGFLSALLLLLLNTPVTPLQSQPPPAPNTQMMKTDLLVVTAHPDDESMMAATMARYADEGRVVSLVVCTHGEGG